MIALSILFVAGFASSLLLGSRLATQSLVTPSEKNRDIMLCLDVSPSMTSVDVKLVETFEKLARDFQGQRIGLDIFNINGSQVFPLTDDYDLIQERLAYAKKILSREKSKMNDDELTEYYDFLRGSGGSGMKLADVSNDEFPASNAGLGLAGCVRHLGDNPSGRSQSVLLATDNELSGEREKVIITTPQAMVLAKQKGIRVYAIDPGVYSETASVTHSGDADNLYGEHAALKNYAILTAGEYYRLSSVDIVPDVIARISKQEAKLFVGDMQLAVADAPLPGFIALTTSIAGILFVLWRLRL